MNKSEQQEREDTKNKSQEKGGEGEEGGADKSMEPGLKHPGRKCTRTGTFGAAALDWNIRGAYGPGLERPGLHQGEEATAAGKKGEENKNKGKMGRREDRPRVVKGEEKEKTESKDNLQSTKEKGGRRGASDWDNRGPEEATQQRGPWDWNICGDASGQDHGAGQEQKPRRGAAGEKREKTWEGASRAEQRGGGGGAKQSGGPVKGVEEKE